MGTQRPYRTQYFYGQATKDSFTMQMEGGVRYSLILQGWLRSSSPARVEGDIKRTPISRTGLMLRILASGENNCP